jgi:hypothetical protein
MAIDTEKVPADIHTTIPGGLYRNAAGQYVDAHGNVLDENKDEDAQKIEDGKAYSEASAKKREEQAANAPVAPAGAAGLPLTQAEFDAKVQLAVATALRAAGVGASAPAKATRTSRSDES